MTHEPKCEKHKKFIFEGCPTDIFEDISVKVPISVCAHSEVCDLNCKCMGHTIEKIHCPENPQYSKFNVIQKISLRIPLKFKVECDVAEGAVSFDLHDCKQNQTPE